MYFGLAKVEGYEGACNISLHRTSFTNSISQMRIIIGVGIAILLIIIIVPIVKLAK